MPPEVLASIFALTIEMRFHPSALDSLMTFAIRDLLNITHTSSRFRDIAVYEPKLWTMVPVISSAVHEDLFEAMLIRSVPLPFCLSFTEDATLPSEDDTKSWMLAMDHARRLGYLNIEVADGFDGVRAKAILRRQFPALQGCIVRFRGLRNVRLDSLTKPIFNGYAPRLRTLDLTNCFTSPGRRCMPNISCVAIRNFSSIPPSFSIDDPSRWRVHFKRLRTLVVWDCFPGSDLPGHHPQKVEFPLLENLDITGPIGLCQRISDSFSYPDECRRTITVLLPQQARLTDAKAGVLAAVAFLPRGEVFEECIIHLDGCLPSVRLGGPRCCAVVLRFRLRQVKVTLGTAMNLFCRAMASFTLPLSISPTLDSFSVLSLRVWDTLASSLASRIDGVTSLRIAAPSDDPSEPVYLLPLLAKMPKVSVLTIESPTLLATDSFLYLSVHHESLLELKKVIVRLEDVGWQEAMMSALANFLQCKLDRGSPIRELVFTVSPQLAQSLGHASADTCQSRSEESNAFEGESLAIISKYLSFRDPFPVGRSGGGSGLALRHRAPAT
ncbi:hypothetical protein FA13DRAFT_1714676 [Coprinellus micaceus]|uniref:Uncharacterized protein n=1 Tax=Coprinellus micaceus TaxID=71717 RepID=A0A4Y7SR69_COPMI|nr:hypothetical protein FA13DRAFT_1714676 [Coprinellus micaceus]